MMVRILLSTRLGELRMTQAELARKTHIRASTINDLYHEIAEGIKFEQLAAICEVLSCDISDILLLDSGRQSDHKTLPIRFKDRV